MLSKKLLIWVTNKLSELEKQMKDPSDLKTTYTIKGKVDLLLELYKDFKLDEVKLENDTNLSSQPS